MNRRVLGAVAAGMLALACVPAQAGLSVTAGDASTVQYGTAVSFGSFKFDTDQSLGGGDFNLISLDPGALVFLPELSSIGGVSFADIFDNLCAPSVCNESSDSPGISVILLPALDLPGDTPVPVVLAFEGAVVGVHSLTYSVTLFDGDLENQFEADGSFKVTVTAIPEPATYALMLGGLAAVAGLARRRRAD